MALLTSLLGGLKQKFRTLRDQQLFYSVIFIILAVGVKDRA